MCDVPRTRAGTLQRARNTPQTITSETVMGEISGLTSLIGASAPPSQAPAAKPQNIPSAWRLRRRAMFRGAVVCKLAWTEFNAAYPEGRLRRGARRRESRNECRLRSHGTDCGEVSQWGLPILRPRDEVLNRVPS